MRGFTLLIFYNINDIESNDRNYRNAELSIVSIDGRSDFEVYFEKDGNKLDIFIHHPKHEARPLENGSGAEKTLAAIAIRIALLNISNMPKCNLIILDEPGAALDEEHLESFTRILDMLKSYFDIVILITHIESLKDIVDMTVEISNTDDGYAFVNQ